MDADGYRHKFAEFLTTEEMADGLTYEQIMTAQTRQDLGISSLNMILVLTHYIEKYANGAVVIQPEWVSLLDDVDGIASVLREIDASSLAQTKG
jgi:hypothetical protein